MQRRIRFTSAWLLALLLLALSFAAWAEAPRQLLLTWQDSPQTTMTITWRCGEKAPGEEAPAAPGVVYYTADPALPFEQYRRQDAPARSFAESPAQLYTVKLTGLTPGALYTAIVESKGERSEPFTFRTIPPAGKKLPSWPAATPATGGTFGGRSIAWPLKTSRTSSSWTAIWSASAPPKSSGTNGSTTGTS
jgi:hypothetical protein